ncbi:MAG: HNH endonuclease [Bryobacterales bacterium]|nr:HNH endonuclease [Bryobacterales bacterium]
MIRIERLQPAPAILLSEGTAEGQSLCDRHDAGEREFHFKPRIYRHPTVLDALNHCHRSKCSYCEQIIDTDGDIEHFRPKAAYYWLAYRWDNLLLACRDCNSAKLQKFPLEDEAHRAVTHRDDHRREKPLLLNPATDDIDTQIGWRSSVVYPKQSDRAGERTIATLKLNRISLVKRRMEVLAQVDILLAAAALTDAPIATRAMAHLETMQTPSHQYSAMIRAYLQSRFAK